MGDSSRFVGGGAIGPPDAGSNSGFGWHSVDPKVVEPLLTVVTLVVVLLLTAATDGGTVDRGPIEIRDLEGTHRFCHFLLSKLMCNGHLLNVSIPKSEKIQVRFSRSRFL